MFDYKATLASMADLDEEALLEILNKVMDNGGEDAQKAVEACQEGMTEVGNRFESGEYFVGDLIYAGEILTQGMEVLKPALAKGNDEKLGKVVLCTVKDDLHDIGKNIVKAMLEAGGLEVIDLGIDTAYETIIRALKENDAHILALSGVLTLALDTMKKTIEEVEAAGLRETTKIIIGGNPVSAEACVGMKADEWAHSPQKTVEVCRKWATA
ncbi:MAG: cobalamin-dependent protein [Roseburia sp.]|nr:cobalamin-dependent protein [Roseburia sp.]